MTERKDPVRPSWQEAGTPDDLGFKTADGWEIDFTRHDREGDVFAIHYTYDWREDGTMEVSTVYLRGLLQEHGYAVELPAGLPQYPSSESCLTEKDEQSLDYEDGGFVARMRVWRYDPSPVRQSEQRGMPVAVFIPARLFVRLLERNGYKVSAPCEGG